MSKDEAMVLAWKTLEDAKHNHKLMALVNNVSVEAWDKYQMDLKIFQAQEALRQALAEPDTGTDRGAWSGVPDATKWVDELRGDEPEFVWVDLTVQEIIDVIHPLVMADMPDEATDYEIARAIEAKLREKNHGQPKRNTDMCGND